MASTCHQVTHSLTLFFSVTFSTASAFLSHPRQIFALRWGEGRLESKDFSENERCFGDVPGHRSSAVGKSQPVPLLHAPEYSGFLGLKAGTRGRQLSASPSFVTDLWRSLGKPLFSGGLQFPNLWNGVGLEPPVSLRGQGDSQSLLSWPWSFRTQLPELRWQVFQLLATWSPRSPLTTWSPSQQLPQRLKPSLLRSSYKSSDPLLSTLSAKPGFKWMLTAMCTHTPFLTNQLV